ncbi:MAG: hypothetical protein JXA10_15440, partial [Anaerolineae bacterium]|nr:hypothetical protein [Anaerolineae bacterium]
MRTKMRLAGLLMIIVLVIAAALPVGAQGKTIPFAAITQDQVVLYGMSDAPTVVQLPGEIQDYRNLIWSPDGRELIVMTADQDYHWQLFMIHTDGTAPTAILNGMQVGLPVNFTSENHLLYAQDTGEVTENDPMFRPILEVMTASRQAPLGSLGRFSYGVGCGGGSSIPVHWLYWNETGSSPGNSPQVLALTPYGVVHSTNCT